MSAARQRLKSAIIELLSCTGLPRLLSPRFGGVGAIIAMHRVRPASTEAFQPNKTLEVTPDFLDRTLSRLRETGFDIISLDQMAERLRTQDFARRFVCLTLDDGYADNYQHAFPVFKAHGAPFSIYLTTGFLDGTCSFWWMLLEAVIRERDAVKLRIDGRTESRRTRNLKEKAFAFQAWHARFRRLSPKAVEAASEHLCADHHIEPARFHAAHAMTWEMARAITADGLGTIEGHTERHVALSLQPVEDIRAEMARANTRIAERTGREPRHFAYPFGDAAAVTRREIDLLADLPPATAVTTRPGVLRPGHGNALTALPRIELNGYYQSRSYVDLALSGLPSLFSRA